MSTATVIVGGLPSLADALLATGQFELVVAVANTDDLRQQLTSGAISGKGKKESLIFLFADTMSAPSIPLGVMVQTLTNANWKVGIVCVSGAGPDLVRQYPAAGALEGPFTTNTVMAACMGLGIQGLVPDPNGNTPLVFNGAPAAPSNAWETPVVAPPKPFEAAPPRPNSEAPAVPFVAPVTAQHEDANAAPPTAPSWGAPSHPAPPAEEDSQTETPSWPSAPPASSSPPPPPPSSGTSYVAAPPTAPPAAPRASWQQPPAPTAEEPEVWHPPTEQSTGWSTPSVTTPPVTAPVFRSSAAPAPLVKRRGFVILVTAPKGGTGKSSTALNMAAFLGLRLRSSGRTVCIVDANTQQADTGKYLQAYTPDITALARDPAGQTPERIQEFLLRREELNLSALLGPALAIDASPYFINPGLYNRAVDLLRLHFDYIIIDSPVAELFHPMFMEFALPQADFIMVPISPNVATMMNTDAWLHNITQPKYAGGPGVDPGIIGIVLNRFEDEIDFTEDKAQEELAGWTYIGAIPESKEWKAANNRADLVVTYNIPEINDAFSHILYYITGEPALLEGHTRITPQKSSLLSRLKSAIGR